VHQFELVDQLLQFAADRHAPNVRVSPESRKRVSVGAPLRRMWDSSRKTRCRKRPRDERQPCQRQFDLPW
jgi:hypothetical protein